MIQVQLYFRYSEKPFLPCKSIKIVTEDAQPLKLICACFNHNDQSGNVVITVAYGSSFRVAFENIVSTVLMFNFPMMSKEIVTAFQSF